MIRAVWRWLDAPANHVTAGEIMARPEYLNLPGEIVERAFSGQFTISPRGDERRVAQGACQPDLYRRALAETGQVLEQSESTQLVLSPDNFFDGRIF